MLNFLPNSIGKLLKTEKFNVAMGIPVEKVVIQLEG